MLKCLSVIPSEKFLESTKDDSDLITKFTYMNLWELPIYFNGNICCLLKVSNVQGVYKVVGIGGSESAKEIHSIITENKLILNNDNYAILKFPDLKLRYIIKKEKNDKINAKEKMYPDKYTKKLLKHNKEVIVEEAIVRIKKKNN